MTFKEQLHAHVGGLVRLKTDLYWYSTRFRDGIKGRICLLLDAADSDTRDRFAVGAAITAIVNASTSTGLNRDKVTAHALLLIDDQAKWIWTSIEDVEFIQ
jgi:hypothetical protein